MKPSELIQEKYDEAELKFLREKSDKDYYARASWAAAMGAAFAWAVTILDIFDERLENLEKK